MIYTGSNASSNSPSPKPDRSIQEYQTDAIRAQFFKTNLEVDRRPFSQNLVGERQLSPTHNINAHKILFSGNATPGDVQSEYGGAGGLAPSILQSS